MECMKRKQIFGNEYEVNVDVGFNEEEKNSFYASNYKLCFGLSIDKTTNG